MYKGNEDKYMTERKEDAFVFGRNVDFEEVVTQYFNGRQLILAGITSRMANRISKLIEQGRPNTSTNSKTCIR